MTTTMTPRTTTGPSTRLAVCIASVGRRLSVTVGANCSERFRELGSSLITFTMFEWCACLVIYFWNVGRSTLRNSGLSSDPQSRTNVDRRLSKPSTRRTIWGECLSRHWYATIRWYIARDKTIFHNLKTFLSRERVSCKSEEKQTTAVTSHHDLNTLCDSFNVTLYYRRFVRNSLKSQ